MTGEEGKLVLLVRAAAAAVWGHVDQMAAVVCVPLVAAVVFVPLVAVVGYVVAAAV